MINFFKSKETHEPKCVLCGRSTTSSDASISFSYSEDDGSAGEKTVGKICVSCADLLDEMERTVHTVVNEED